MLILWYVKMSEDKFKTKPENSITWGTSGKEGQLKVYYDVETTEEELQKLITLGLKGLQLITNLKG